MPLKATLMNDMKDAMRARDQVRLDTIRFLLSELKNFEIDNGPQEDEGVQKVVTRVVKQMTEAIEEFRKGDREDLAEAESAKLQIMQAYLPAQLSDAELQQLVAEAISGLDQPTMGQAMKAAMAKVAGQADGKRVSAIVNQLLQS